MRLTWTVFLYLLRRSFVAAFDDNCFGIAKGAAYSALLSFFPVLTSAATILVQTRAEFVTRTLESFLSEIVPPGTEDIVMMQFRVKGTRSPLLLIFAILLSLWAASRVITSLMEGFQSAYRVPRSFGFWRETVVSTSLVLLATIPLIGASALILFGSQVETAAPNWIKVDAIWTPFAWVWQWLSRITRYAVAFGTTIVVTALLYYFGPNRRQSWSGVWRGAVFATVLWMLATMGFAWYVRHLAHYNVLYGSIGTSIALLVWMYVMAAIALVGCEFNAEYERLTQAQSVPPHAG